MPKVSKDSAAEHTDHGPVEEWSEEVEGYVVTFACFAVDIDSTPLLKGLPGDRCPCAHWGYVFKGRVIYTFADREEAHEAGDAFYVEGGHLQRANAGTEYLQFSPAGEARTVSEAIAKNMQRMREA